MTEKGLEVVEGAAAVPARPYVGTHVVERQRVDPLAVGRTEDVQFEAPRSKEAAMAMDALFRGGVSAMVGGKVRAVRLMAAITLEPGTPMLSKVIVVEPFATV